MKMIGKELHCPKCGHIQGVPQMPEGQQGDEQKLEQIISLLEQAKQAIAKALTILECLPKSKI